MAISGASRTTSSRASKRARASSWMKQAESNSRAPSKARRAARFSGSASSRLKDTRDLRARHRNSAGGEPFGFEPEPVEQPAVGRGVWIARRQQFLAVEDRICASEKAQRLQLVA